MWVDWKIYRPRITITGISAWELGKTLGWRGMVAEHDIVFFTAGNGRLDGQREKTIPLLPGTCLWLTPGHLYVGNQAPDQPVGNYYIHFELLDSAGNVRPYDMPTPPEQITDIDAEAVEAAFRRITTILPFYSIEHADRIGPERIAVAEAILLGLLMDLDLATQNRQPEAAFGLKRHHSETMMRILRDLHACPNEPRTVQSLADDAGYSSAHFSRVFYTVIGQWPEQFLIDHRMARAKLMLATSAMSIREIAESLGYKHISFFSTQFRQKFGCSPRTYRQQHENA